MLILKVNNSACFLPRPRIVRVRHTSGEPYYILTDPTVNNDDCNLPEKLAMSLSSRPVSAMTLLNNIPESMSSSKVDVEAKGADMIVAEEWKPTRHEWLIMVSLAFISFVVSLDATILVTVLPVSSLSLLV